ncbi:hypothetical protein BpHYR1_039252, partial [Brachionus plicatilis]
HKKTKILKLRKFTGPYKCRITKIYKKRVYKILNKPRNIFYQIVRLAIQFSDYQIYFLPYFCSLVYDETNFEIQRTILSYWGGRSIEN